MTEVMRNHTMVDAIENEREETTTKNEPGTG